MEDLELVAGLLRRAGMLVDDGDFDDLVALLAAANKRDLAIVRASRRWADDAFLGVEYLPGDVLGVRMRNVAAAVSGALSAMLVARRAAGDDNAEGLRLSATVLMSFAAALAGSVPYFLPVTSAVGILGSRVPEDRYLDELRLPFPVVAVYFGADLAIPAELLRLPDDWPSSTGADSDLHGLRQTLAAAVADLGLDEEHTRHLDFGRPLAEEFQERGGYLGGVMVFADAEGRPSDLVGFLVTQDRSGASAGPAGRTWALAPGLVSSSTLGPLVLNVAAAVAWGGWHPPPAPLDLPADVDSAEFRRALRRGAFRRREPAGAAAAVRVLDAGPPTETRRAAGPGSPHASPIAHLRRGYFQRHRVGPRGEWHYEMRFHPPRLVNPGGREDRGVKVYRLPVPPPPPQP